MRRSGSPAPEPRPPGPGDPGLAARMEELGRISAELLHDLAGSLSIVSARVVVARQQAELGEVPLPELVELQRESDELRAMLTEILDELKSPTRSPERAFDPGEEAERAIDRWYRGGTDVSVRFHSDLPEGVRVLGPRTLFTRGLSNLLRNAARHARSRVVVTLEATPQVVELRVEDDGPGVSPAFVGALFEPMSATPHGGHGLGLSFCRWSATRLGGELDYAGNSPALGGADFRLRLPRAAPVRRRRTSTSTGPVRRDDPRPEPGSTGLALVIDDDPAVGSALARRLGREGWDAHVLAVTGRDSAATLARRVLERSPRLVLVDQGLGQVEGLDVVRWLGASDARGVAVVLMTGGDTSNLVERGAEVVHKLENWPRILEAVDAALERAGPGPRSANG